MNREEGEVPRVCGLCPRLEVGRHLALELGLLARQADLRERGSRLLHPVLLRKKSDTPTGKDLRCLCDRVELALPGLLTLLVLRGLRLAHLPELCEVLLVLGEGRLGVCLLALRVRERLLFLGFLHNVPLALVF